MTIRFTSLADVREFVSIATLQPYSVLGLDGDRAVDAKSFMEMFTLDVTRPLHVDVGANEASFAVAAKKYICES